MVSEVFTRACAAWPRFDPSRGSAAAWLMGIAHHTVADWWRRQRPRGARREVPVAEAEAQQLVGEPLLSALGPGPEDAVLEDELLARLEQSLQLLQDREREALALRFAGRLKAAEVGVILGLSEGATKMLIHRAILKLKAVLVHDH